MSMPAARWVGLALCLLLCCLYTMHSVVKGATGVTFLASFGYLAGITPPKQQIHRGRRLRMGLSSGDKSKNKILALRNTGFSSYADFVQKEDFREEEALHIVYVMCGEERSDEFMASLKSLYLFAKVALNADQNYYHIHVITADTNGTEEVGGLQPQSNFRLTFHKMVMEAPELFGPCAMQTLYIHESAEFDDIDQVIYLDLDTLWLDDPRELWSHFHAMNARGAFFGAVEEAREGGWYAGNKPGEDIPYYGQGSSSRGVGLNSGVMMISLARLRAQNFSAERDVIEQRWGRKHLRLGPQDVLNVYGAEHPERIYELPCIFNFRIGAGCDSDTGMPIILHGNARLKDDVTIVKGNSYRHIFDVMSSLGR